MSTWKILDENFDKAKIMALGVGGCGGNIISNIADAGVNGIELVSINTDSQEQNIIHKSKKIKIGDGHGAGNDPESANKIAQDSKDIITKIFDEKPEVLFITAGMGGRNRYRRNTSNCKNCKRIGHFDYCTGYYTI